MKELDFKLFLELGKWDVVDSEVTVALTDKEYEDLIASYQDGCDFDECGDIYDKVYAAAEEQLLQEAEDFPDDYDYDVDEEDEDGIFLPPFKVDYPDCLADEFGD